MSFVLFAALAAGAPQVPPPLPMRATSPPAAPTGRLDGRWAVVYAEQVGHRADIGPALDVRHGTVILPFDGRPRTYRLDFGPGHTVQATPVTAESPAPVPAAAEPPAPRPPALPPTTVPRPPSERTGISNAGLPLNRGTPGSPTAGSPPATGTGTSPSPDQGTAGRVAVTPGALQGTFILSNEFLCLSLSPTGEAALGTSPGTVRGGDVGPGPAPGSAASRAAVPPAATPAAVPGVRQDALILILRRAAPPAVP